MLRPVLLLLLFFFAGCLADDADGTCQIGSGWSQEQACQFVRNNSDACEGGGYLMWSDYVECAGNSTARIFVIIGGVLFLLLLFVMISTAADDFFSPNVAAIVAHLKISESVAGVTFLAFGNGAPDIFGAIASVLSSPTPKAGLALGELLGAGIFVTTMVMATIVITKPFEAETFAPIRDISFYLVALAWILFVFLYKKEVFIWEPAVYLGMYVVYVVTVIVGQKLYSRSRKNAKRNGTVHRSSTRRGNSIHPIPSISITEVEVEKNQAAFSIFPPTNFADAFGGEEDSGDEEVLVVHNTVYVGHEARERAESIAPPPAPISNWQTMFWDLYEHLKPLSDREEWEEANIIVKILLVIKIVPMVLFKATVPMHEASWSKPIALAYALFSPMFVVFAIKVVAIVPFDGSPGIWAYALGASLILVVLVFFFTSFEHEPKHYQTLYSYLGFIMSLSWMYFIATEVVNVVTMIGVISKLSHEVLGLTILAWSNSIGDLISDVSVAKQGFSRMAMAAAIGGPLFNLLMGFGIPFLIAKAAGRKVTIAFTPIYHILILFLAISLITSLISILVQRFNLRRPYGFVLIAVYVCFLIMVVLTETNVVVWGTPDPSDT